MTQLHERNRQNIHNKYKHEISFKKKSFTEKLEIKNGKNTKNKARHQEFLELICIELTSNINLMKFIDFKANLTSRK